MGGEVDISTDVSNLPWAYALCDRAVPAMSTAHSGAASRCEQAALAEEEPVKTRRRRLGKLESKDRRRIMRRIRKDAEQSCAQQVGDPAHQPAELVLVST